MGVEVVEAVVVAVLVEGEDVMNDELEPASYTWCKYIVAVWADVYALRAALPVIPVDLTKGSWYGIRGGNWWLVELVVVAGEEAKAGVY